MEYPDLMVEDVAPPSESPDPGSFDPSLMEEALIKAGKLRRFIKETADELGTSHESATAGMVWDYNVLRALVVGAWPGLAATLPPEVPLAGSGPRSGSVEQEVTYRELIFFCDQIKGFLGRWVGSNPAPRVNDGPSLFGPNGFKHDPALLAAARVKAQTLVDFIQTIYVWNGRAPIALVEDYNQLHGLIREAVPELAPVLPREILIPGDPKPSPEDQLASSSRAGFFWFLNREPRPKTPTLRELLYLCQQIARLLK